jgi:hypothetical protein
LGWRGPPHCSEQKGIEMPGGAAASFRCLRLFITLTFLKEQHEMPPAELLSGFRADSNLTRRPIFIIIALVLISVLPVILFSHIPLIDYPNHLARLQIHKMLSQNSYIARFYEFHWRFIPYLG